MVFILDITLSMVNDHINNGKRSFRSCQKYLNDLDLLEYEEDEVAS